MQCPRCGGMENRPLDRGSFECISQIALGDRLIGVVPANPYQPFEVPVYHPTYGPCRHQFTEQEAISAFEARAQASRAQQEAARARAKAAETQRVAVERRREWEEARDATILEDLPHIAVPAHPGGRPHDSEPDAFWFAGFIPYWIGCTLVLWLFMFALQGDRFVLAAILGALPYLTWLGYALSKAFRLRHAHRIALAAHLSANEAESRREAERTRRRQIQRYSG